MEANSKRLDAVTVTHDNVSWVDIESPGQDVLEDLAVVYRIHPVHLHESVQKVQHSRVEVEKDYLFFVLHFPIYANRSDGILFGQIGFFLGRDFVLTLRDARCASLAQVREELRAQGNGSQVFKNGPSFVLHKIINALIDEFSYLTDSVITELDGLESVVFEDNVSDARKIGKVRRKIARLMRLIGPKRYVLQDLSEQAGSFVSHDAAKLYSNNAKRATKLWEIVEEAKETVEIYKDADFTTSTERTNEILAVLTLIFTLTIPTTVISGLYGMNILLPGGIESGDWMFLGRYTTLFFVLALSGIMATIMMVYFKTKKWF